MASAHCFDIQEVPGCGNLAMVRQHEGFLHFHLPPPIVAAGPWGQSEEETVQTRTRLLGQRQGDAVPASRAFSWVSEGRDRMLFDHGGGGVRRRTSREPLSHRGTGR